MKTYDAIGVQIPRILLPRPGMDLTRWAVIACDQFTSQPEYWDEVERIVGDAPSTYHMILPEVYLDGPQEERRIRSTQAAMRAYLDAGYLTPFEGMVYVERSVAGRVRHGLVLALDLERYDYHAGSTSLIRATEGTILERLPPRIRIREGAPLELPHILVLIDDPQGTVIEPLAAARAQMRRLYDFDLMLDSGHLTGYGVDDPQLEAGVVEALARLAGHEAFEQHYGVGAEESVLLFAMGDGNHSLATAKAIWERLKPEVGMDHPARYALVEIENVHDEGLDFEPIHRVLFGIQTDLEAALQRRFDGGASYRPVASQAAMVAAVDQNAGPTQRIGLVRGAEFGVIEIGRPPANLAVGSLQPFLDDLLATHAAEKIDYVHGAEVCVRLGAQPGNAGFYLPAMHKGDLFKTILVDGALPRKTFSMGQAREKRFYMEARRIVP